MSDEHARRLQRTRGTYRELRDWGWSRPFAGTVAPAYAFVSYVFDWYDWVVNRA